MYCSKCGKHIQQHSSFCKNCGTSHLETRGDAYDFKRKIIIYYLLWIIIHLGILLVFSDGPFASHNMGARVFWPLGEYAYFNEAHHYDITEFLFYSVLPLFVFIFQREFRFSKITKTKKTINQNNRVIILKNNKKINVKHLIDGRKFEIHSSLELGWTIGDSVTINGSIAADGIYRFSRYNSIEVKNGKIVQL